MNISNPGDSLKLSLSLNNPYESDIDFNHARFPVELCAIFLKGRDIMIVQVFPDQPVINVVAGETIDRTVSLMIPDLPEGKYNFFLSLNMIFKPPISSHYTKINLRKDD